MKNPKDDIELEVMEAFTTTKSDQEIGMPDVEQELMKLKAKRNHQRINPLRKIAASIAIIVAVSGIAVAAIVNHQAISNFFTPEKNVVVEEQPIKPTLVPNELQIIPSDTIVVKTGAIMFEEAELAEIMTSISNTYKKVVVFKNEELKHIHLHFQYNTEDALNDVLKNLNMFEKIHVKLNDEKLEVE